MATRSPKSGVAAAVDPFGGLWTFDGPLAEEVRVCKLKLSPAAYCAISHDTCLHGDDTHVRVEKGARIYRGGDGEDYATLRVDDAVVVLTFVAPIETEHDPRFYRAVRGKPEWLEFRRPATRDPRPDLEADVGALLGAAAYERRTKGVWQHRTSASGAYLALPMRRVPRWPGGKRAKQVASGGDAIVDVSDGVSGLVLGPGTLRVWPTDHGPVLVRGACEDEAMLRRHLKKLPKAGWTRLAGRLGEAGERIWVAFDAKLSGYSIGAALSLRFRLERGAHHVERCAYKPDARTDLVLVRFVPTST